MMPFALFELLFSVAFLFIFGMIVYTVIKNIKESANNKKMPILDVTAEVATKRTHTSAHNGVNHATHTSASYYTTFQVESGDRMEFRISGTEYGMLREGDKGKLRFQGTKYISFIRT